MRATIPGTFSVLPGQAYEPTLLEDRPLLKGDFDNDCRITPFDTLQITDKWGTESGNGDLIADGAVNLDDLAAAVQRQGMDCVTAAGATSLNVPTEEARFLLFLPQEEAIVGEQLTAYVMVEEVDDLGGFEFTLSYNPRVVRLQDASLHESLSGDVLPLGPTINNGTSTVTFGAFDRAMVYTGQASRSQIQQVMASARQSTNMANLQVLSTLVFDVVGTGNVAIQVSEAQAIDSEGLRLATTLDTNRGSDLVVEVGYLYLPLVVR